MKWGNKMRILEIKRNYNLLYGGKSEGTRRGDD